MNLRALLTLSLLGPVSPVAAQAVDEGTLVIRSGGREIGTERFRVSYGDAGLRIVAKATMVASRPAEFNITLERTDTTGELAFQLERHGAGGGGQIYAVQKRNKLTIRRVERSGEQASESPGGSNLVLLADSVFAPYLQILPLANESGRSITAVFPLTARRVQATAKVQPSTSAGGTLIRLSGGLEGEIALGNRGELLRISLPALGLEAVRKRD